MSVIDPTITESLKDGASFPWRPSHGLPSVAEFKEFMKHHCKVKMTAEQLRFAREQAGIHREGFTQYFETDRNWKIGPR